MYLLGIDGGGTKTHCIIGDEKGNIFAEGFGGPANYQMSGMETTRHSVRTAINRALDKLNVPIEDIAYAVLGLSGADYEVDFTNLQSMCSTIFKEVPFKIVNDCWMGLRAGSNENWGIVSVCGAGHGCMGKDIKGHKVELRNMYYELGNRGGKGEIIREALHHAFRADEGLGAATRLTIEIPRELGVETMRATDLVVREEGINSEIFTKIPNIVSELAKEEDEIAQFIMISMGNALGETAAGVIKRLQLEKSQVPIVLVGSIFTGDNPLLMDAYRLAVHKVAPYARFIVLDKKPVMGAYYLAMDEVNK